VEPAAEEFVFVCVCVCVCVCVFCREGSDRLVRVTRAVDQPMSSGHDPQMCTGSQTLRV
jgi:hypothetical protein